MGVVEGVHSLLSQSFSGFVLARNGIIDILLLALLLLPTKSICTLSILEHPKTLAQLHTIQEPNLQHSLGRNANDREYLPHFGPLYAPLELLVPKDTSARSWPKRTLDSVVRFFSGGM